MGIVGAGIYLPAVCGAKNTPIQRWPDRRTPDRRRGAEYTAGTHFLLPLYRAYRCFSPSSCKIQLYALACTPGCSLVAIQCWNSHRFAEAHP